MEPRPSSGSGGWRVVERWPCGSVRFGAGLQGAAFVAYGVRSTLGFLGRTELSLTCRRLACLGFPELPGRSTSLGSVAA